MTFLDNSVLFLVDSMLDKAHLTYVENSYRVLRRIAEDVDTCNEARSRPRSMPDGSSHANGPTLRRLRKRPFTYDFGGCLLVWSNARSRGLVQSK